jgi:hypothetical protein
LLRHGQADAAIVVAGDTLTRAVYEWYETAGLLSPACYNAQPVPEAAGFIPSEGVAALVLEPERRRETRSYAKLRSGRWAAGGQAVETVRQMLGGSVPTLTVCTTNGAPCATSPVAAVAREIAGDGGTIISPQAAAAGLADTGALLHLILALSIRSESGQLLLLGTSGDNGFAAILLERP